jgi:hypothetical protein
LKDPTPSDSIARLSQAVQEDVFTRFDVETVRNKFPDCNPKLHRRIGALNRLRRLRSQDAQHEFERTIAIAMERKRETESRSPIVPGSAQQPVLLDHNRIALAQLLEDFGVSNNDSEAASVASTSASSGYEPWSLREDDSKDIGIMKPQFMRTGNQPLTIPRLPLKSSATLDRTNTSNCPFCMMSMERQLIQTEWE